ncbi:Folate-binding protein [Rickettsiales endosymbiont of Paramecium tredecaurelia]|uniref:CAF17-like 4Fe-4S cluster assembly/insertion protein YgfZ n=1 Tax=Candidatus Sarmatiella mevalonica TaxID=2770581 RepID=UPI0019230D0D|nr:hypothetical protein [Candidatus Sarmatiella mevalonica]MBL3284391.1 Folate-binding protein [Candidatus Sarmatiella mevalonica]
MRATSQLIHRSLLLVYGADAFRFLQSLITNDLSITQEKIDDSEVRVVYTYLLTPEGKYLFDFFIFYNHIDSSFFIDVATTQKEWLIQYLLKYKLRSRIEIEDSILRIKYSMDVKDAYLYAKDPRCSKLGYRVVHSNLDDDSNFGNSYIEDKYLFAIPDGPLDYHVNRSIILEYGARELNALSYSKGCYVGQELITNIRTKGTVRKQLFGISCANYQPTQPDECILINQQQEVGRVLSYYIDASNVMHGIAMINTELYSAIHPTLLSNQEVQISTPPWRNV